MKKPLNLGKIYCFFTLLVRIAARSLVQPHGAGGQSRPCADCGCVFDLWGFNSEVCLCFAPSEFSALKTWPTAAWGQGWQRRRQQTDWKSREEDNGGEGFEGLE